MFDSLYARGAGAGCFSGPAWLGALCDVEAALARAQAELGEIPASAGPAIAAGCARLAAADADLLERSLAAHATPVVGLVTALRETVAEPARVHVHAGATSQDILDTALMLLIRRALDSLLGDLAGAAEAAARLADAHRRTPMIARTLLQQALPTTFGLVAAGWLDGLDQSRGHLAHVRDAELAVQMGGPVGGRDPGVAAHVAAALGLAEPTLGWATVRVRPALTASVLGVSAGVVAKIARDVTLLSQTEVGELREGRAGGSSAMAHKRNPVAAVSALACAKRVPGLVSTVLAAMEQEDQRAAGAWQAEWGTLGELVTLTGSGLAWLRDCLTGLQVDTARMAEHLAGAPVGERTEAPDGVQTLIDRALAVHRAG